MERIRYNEDFKKTIVDLHLSGNQSVKDLSGEYGVSEVTIYKWLKDYAPIEAGDTLTPKDIAAMQKENLRLKQELEILKKAMAIFAKD